MPLQIDRSLNGPASLPHCFAASLLHLLTGSLACWFIRLLVRWLIVKLVYWLILPLVHWLISPLINLLLAYLAELMPADWSYKYIWKLRIVAYISALASGGSLLQLVSAGVAHGFCPSVWTIVLGHGFGEYAQISWFLSGLTLCLWLAS